MQNKTIGVIGLGSIGMRHAKNLLDMGHTVYGKDPDILKLGELSQAGGVNLDGKKPYSMDGMVLALPTNQHCVEAMEAPSGIPLLIEKPIGCCDGDLIHLKHVDNEIYVGNNLRFHSCVKQAKEWLDAGEIGDPLWAEFTCAQYNNKYTDDVVLNWGAHELDLARYLLGEAMVINAYGNKNICDITLQHIERNNCRTHVHLDYLTEPELRGFTIAGTKGNIHVTLSPMRRVFLDRKLGSGKDCKMTLAEDSYDKNYIEEMQAFIDAIDGKPSPLLATAEDGLAALELILKAKELARI